MKITWIGHSCFTLEKNGYTVVMDPYTDGSVPGLLDMRLQANEVLCSHEHGDHNGRDCVTIVSGAESPFSVKVLDTYHDEVKGRKRGPNKIHIIDDGSCKVAHLGDLGCDLEPQQMEQLKECDIILIPVGGFYTIDGKQAAALVKELDTKLVIPMHFRDDAAGFGFSVIGTVSNFTEEMADVSKVQGSTIDTEKEYNAQVLVLNPLQSK